MASQPGRHTHTHTHTQSTLVYTFRSKISNKDSSSNIFHHRPVCDYNEGRHDDRDIVIINVQCT